MPGPGAPAHRLERAPAASITLPTLHAAVSPSPDDVTYFAGAGAAFT